MHTSFPRSVLCVALLGGGIFGCTPSDDPGRVRSGTEEQVKTPTTVDLPGAFFPESIALSTGGTLYTGNPSNGEIDLVATSTGTVGVFVPAGVNKGSFGLKFDDARQVLWVCDVDLVGGAPSNLRAFRATDGQLDKSFELPAGGGCADITIGAGGVLYVTDIFRSTIMRLEPNAPALEADWCTSPLFAGSDPANPLKVGGIDAVSKDGHERLFVDKRDSGDLFTIEVDGGACKPPVKLAVDKPLPFNDGIRAVDFDTVLVTVNATTLDAVATGGPITGALLSVKVDGERGRVTVVRDSLDQPTSVVIDQGAAWVSEGQILRFAGIDRTPPNLPFKLRRVPLE